MADQDGGGEQGAQAGQATLTLTLSNFTPKPHTPFQWHSVSTEEFERRGSLLKEALKKVDGVKSNWTSIRISAMEDFIGRGDRSMCGVIRRSWELARTRTRGGTARTPSFRAFDQAIDEAGLTWKYRQVVNGEWDVLEKLGDEARAGRWRQGRADRGALADERTGRAPALGSHRHRYLQVVKLKADLQKALEGITVPDCSHSGICTECGVCGDEFGENVVAEVLPLPVFEGHYVPDGRRTQRLRFRFTKDGEGELHRTPSTRSDSWEPVPPPRRAPRSP